MNLPTKQVADALDASNKLLWEVYQWGLINSFNSMLHYEIQIRCSENDKILEHLDVKCPKP